MPSYCQECATQVDSSVNFCPNCGTRIEAGAPPSTPIEHAPGASFAIDQASLHRMTAAAADLAATASHKMAAVTTAARPVLESASKSVGTSIANPVIFAMSYVVFMLPTYVLPYVGSNSSVLNTLGAASGAGLNPAFYFHFAALVVLIVIAWFRGKATAKGWLIALPVAAALFDLLPGLSMIPMVPTTLHLVTIVLGVKEERSAERTG